MACYLKSRENCDSYWSYTRLGAKINTLYIAINENGWPAIDFWGREGHINFFRYHPFFWNFQLKFEFYYSSTKNWQFTKKWRSHFQNSIWLRKFCARSHWNSIILRGPPTPLFSEFLANLNKIWVFAALAPLHNRQIDSSKKINTLNILPLMKIGGPRSIFGGAGVTKNV